MPAVIEIEEVPQWAASDNRFRFEGQKKAPEGSFVEIRRLRLLAPGHEAEQTKASQQHCIGAWFGNGAHGKVPARWDAAIVGAVIG